MTIKSKLNLVLWVYERKLFVRFCLSEVGLEKVSTFPVENTFQLKK